MNTMHSAFLFTAALAAVIPAVGTADTLYGTYRDTLFEYHFAIDSDANCAELTDVWFLYDPVYTSEPMPLGPFGVSVPSTIREGIYDPTNPDPDAAMPSGPAYLVTSIGAGAFSSLSALTTGEGDAVTFDFSVPDGIASIGDQAFQTMTRNFFFSSQDLPSSLVYIGEYAFEGIEAMSLTSLIASHVTLPASLEYIGQWAFGSVPGPGFGLADEWGVYWLDGWVVGYDSDAGQGRQCAVLDLSSAKGIAAAVFQDANQIRSVTLPANLKIIPKYAFFGCTSLGLDAGHGSFTIPASVTNIEYGAFEQCSNITNFVFEGNAPAVDGDAFRDVGLGVLTEGVELPIATVNPATLGWGAEGSVWNGLRIVYDTSTPPPPTYTVTWKDDNGSVLGTDTLAYGATPSREGPSKADSAPYSYAFAGWTPAIVPVTGEASYTATYTRTADLSTLTGDWTASDGDVLTNSTAYVVTILAGATVTINGVTVAGGAGSDPSGAAVFADGGEAITTSIAPGANGTWSLTAFAELASGSADGLDDAQVKVYAANTLSGLTSAQPMASGVVVTNKAPAVKVELEVTPPANADAQFFRVGFGD